MPENDAKPLPKAKVRRSIQTAITDAKAFVNQQLWDRDLAALPRIKRLAFSLCRICTIVTKGFISDRCALQASALTYISLMSMVPVLALMLSLSKGFGAQEVLMETIGIRRVQSTAAADARPPLDNSASGAEVPQTQPDPEGLGIDMNSPFEVIEGSKLSELPPQAAKVIQV